MLDIVSSLEKEDCRKEFIKALTVARDQKTVKKTFIGTYPWYQKK